MDPIVVTLTQEPVGSWTATVLGCPDAGGDGFATPSEALRWAARAIEARTDPPARTVSPCRKGWPR